jgi:two-component system response regulator VicR
MAKPKKPNKKILVVEDEPLLSSMYVTVLRRAFRDIYQASTKQDGIKIIMRILPDLILLDLMIPTTAVIDIKSDFHEPVGFELLKEIRRFSKTKNTKVIILSNLDADEHRQRAIKLGAVDYIVKASVTPQLVADRVQQFLK